MSTRSVIARPVGDEWEGRYHHSDGYPTGLGAELWRLVQLEGVEWTRKTLIDDHPAGWSCILGADWSQAPGYHEHPDLDKLMDNAYGPRCYCHGDRAEEAQMYHSRDEKRDPSAPLFIEWVYVLGALGLAVYMSVPKSKRKNARYTWRYVDTFQWAGPEPDWKAIEQIRYPEAA